MCLSFSSPELLLPRQGFVFLSSMLRRLNRTSSSQLDVLPCTQNFDTYRFITRHFLQGDGAAVALPTVVARPVASYMKAVQDRSSRPGEDDVTSYAPAEQSAWRQRTWREDAEREATERKSLSVFFTRLDAYFAMLRVHKADVERECTANAEGKGSLEPPRTTPLVSMGGSQLPTTLTWVLQAHTDGHDTMGGKCIHTATPSPAVYYGDKSAFTARTKTKKREHPFHHVPKAFAEAYRRVNAPEQRRRWIQFYRSLREEGEEVAEGNSRAASKGTTRRGSAGLPKLRKRAQQQVPPARFYWEEDEEPNHSDGRGCGKCYGTLLSMIPSSPPSLRTPEGVLTADSASLPIPSSSSAAALSLFWIPLPLLRYLPHFPLPSSLALQALSTDPPSSPCARGTLYDFPSHTPLLGHKRTTATTTGARVVEEAFHATTAECSPPGSTSSPSYPNDTFSLAACSAEHLSAEEHHPARAATAAAAVPRVPEALLRGFLSRWSAFWARARDPTAPVHRTYFFPYQVYPLLEQRSRDRLRISSSGFNSRKTAHLDEQAQRAAMRRMRDEFALPQRQQQHQQQQQQGQSGSPCFSSAVLTWANRVTCLGDSYVNAADMLFASFIDGQTCVQHVVPLDECGNVFYEAIPAVRQQSQRNLRDGGRLLTHIAHCLQLRAKEGDTARMPDGSLSVPAQEEAWLGQENQGGRHEEYMRRHTVLEDAFAADIDTPADEGQEGQDVRIGAKQDRRSEKKMAPTTRKASRERCRTGKPRGYHIAMRQTERLIHLAKHHAPQQPEARTGSPPPPAVTAAASLWLARLHREDSSVVAAYMGRIANAAERRSALRGWERECGFVFRSPYWIDVATMEARWGTVPLPRVVPITVNGRQYVNAEQTTDAARFNPLTCVPRRTHEVLTSDALLTCSWDCSSELRQTILRQRQAPLSATPPHREAGDGVQVSSAFDSTFLNQPKTTKSTQDIHREADEIAQTDNLWVTLDVVKLAEWTLQENALVATIPVSEVLARHAYGRVPFVAAHNHDGSPAGMSSWASQEMVPPLAASDGTASFTAKRGDAASPESSLTCVYACDIVEREELVQVLSYSPVVYYGKCSTELTPADDGFLDWRQAQETATKAAGCAAAACAMHDGGLSTAAHPHQDESSAAQRFADRLRRSALRAKRGKETRRWRLPLASRLKLALLAIPMKRSAAGHKGVGGPAATQQRPRDVWVTPEFLRAEATVRPIGGRGAAVTATEVDVVELTRLSPTASLGPSSVRQKLTLVHHSELEWPDADTEAKESATWLFARM